VLWCAVLMSTAAGIIKEVAMMRMLAGHPCAVQLYGVYESDTHFYLVSSLAQSAWSFWERHRET
jgi:hypothetical protein